MSAATNLKRRGAVYYCRRRIPKDLIAHYGTTELSVSLRTKDLREARRLASEQWLQWEADFDRIRAGRGVSELSAELIEALGTQWVAGVLAEDEGCRIDGSMRGIIDENTRHLQELEAAYRKSLAHGEFLLIERHADDVLHRAGIKLGRVNTTGHLYGILRRWKSPKRSTARSSTACPSNAATSAIRICA